MHIVNEPRTYESGITGPAPVIWYGSASPNGDSKPFSGVPIGSIYVQTGASNNIWHKTTDAGHDSDWSVGMACLAARVTSSQFTDGGSTSGTYTLSGSIPANAYVLRTVISDVTGFTGDTSAALIVGDGSDTDRYCTASTVNVFTTVQALDGGAPSGTQIHTAAKTPVLTITSATDFTNVTAGALTVKIFYLI